jgi:methylated-DNA-[protein]-cysteine S-methyltransferase
MTAFSEKKVLDVLSQYASEPFPPAALSYGLSLGLVTNIPGISQVRIFTMTAAAHQALYDSPVGRLAIREAGGAIMAVEFANTVKVRASSRPRVALDGRPGKVPLSPALRTCLAQLDEYFCGARRDFDLKVAGAGTDFQQRVWRELTRIPYGQTRTYGEVAAAIGRPKGPRAVGQANNRNPVAIIVPCHRVVGTHGLVGYGGGLSRKRWLLKHERANRCSNPPARP